MMIELVYLSVDKVNMKSNLDFKVVRHEYVIYVKAIVLTIYQLLIF